MESIQKLVIWTLIGNVFITKLANAQDQQGFISLDCGLPSKESGYTEQTTGLIYSSDTGFIRSGNSGIIKIDDEAKYLKPYRHLRYFTEGTRNCYNLTVKQDTQYLIRAVFVYGNYDGLNARPKFDLYIGPNIWATINFQDGFSSHENMMEDGMILEESIYTPKSNYLDICVVKTGTTMPFMSTLEVRPLRDNAYVTETGSLKLVSRVYFADSESIIRYPGDVHDRYWEPLNQFNWMLINTTAAEDPPNAYGLPKAIITNYVTPENSNESLMLDWSVHENFPGQVYVYLHFAEMQALKPSNTREFKIEWNGKLVDGEYSPPEFMVDTVHFSQTCGIGYCTMELLKTRASSFPPLLNAVELFVVMPYLQTDTDENDVIAIKNIQAIHKIKRISWQGDPCAPVEYMWDGLNCSRKTNPSSSIPPRIISLDLSSSGLTGTIPREIGNLSQLQKLDLSNNNLTGGIPEFLANLKSLTIINLSSNKFSGSVPRSLRNLEKKGLKLIVQGNPNLCLSPACEREENNKKEWLVPIVASVSSLAVATVVFVLIFFTYKSRRQSKALHPSIVAHKIRYTREEVSSMTNNFQRALGQGGFGVVYHGYLNGNKQVAVKVLSQSSSQGYRQFRAEVELLLRVHHINLVTLVGYCDEENHMVLIYDYMPNGDLKQHLSGATSSLSWATRLRIAAETAQGLEYLHMGCKPPMIHRDVKTMNILLDEHFQAKLGDFGLSRSFPIGSKTHISTNVVGSPGYLDPDYNKTNRLTEKSDVFSFGIVVLELITSQSVIDQTREKPHIAEWVTFMLTNGNIENIVDPNLPRDYDCSSLWKALELAMSCVNHSASERPSMSQVAVELRECLLYENLRKEGRSDMDSKSSVGTGSSHDSP